MKKNLLLAFTALLFAFTASAQTNQELALQKGKQAVALEDEGKFDEALTLLSEAQKLDPADLTYPYEMTYCFYSRKEYQRTIDTLEKIKNKPGSFDRIYQLLGNSYDIIGQSSKAITVYDEGLKKFPKAGCLYLERGIVPLVAKDYNNALTFFEKGIEAEPSFSSNYFWAAKIYIASEEKVWGMIYGELFMNLERNTKRTVEISKLLYDTYKSQITFTEPDKISVSFSKRYNVSATGSIKLPFNMIYEANTSMAVAAEKVIDINTLDRIRQNFLSFYFKQESDKKYPNALFAYQNLISKSGHMEAYNHWILMQGDTDAFNTWQNANKTKWDSFATWFGDNQMTLSPQNYFIRWQYN